MVTAEENDPEPRPWEQAEGIHWKNLEQNHRRGGTHAFPFVSAGNHEFNHEPDKCNRAY